MSGILRAMVRPVPRSFANATVEHPAVIDTELAVSQHRRYVAALSTLVDQIVWAPAADDAPDSVFVEDQVVVCDGVALFTRSGVCLVAWNSRASNTRCLHLYRGRTCLRQRP